MERAGEDTIGHVTAIKRQTGMGTGIGESMDFVVDLAEHDGLPMHGDSLRILIRQFVFVINRVPVGHEVEVP